LVWNAVSGLARASLFAKKSSPRQPNPGLLGNAPKQLQQLSLNTGFRSAAYFAPSILNRRRGQSDMRFLILILCISKVLAQSPPELVLQTGHAGFVDQLEFSASGRVLLSHGIDGSIRVWDLTTHSLIRTWDNDFLIADGNQDFALSASGKEILFGGVTDEAKVVSVATQKEVSGFSPTITSATERANPASEVRFGITAVAESPDGQWRVASNNQGCIVAFQEGSDRATTIQRSGRPAMNFWFNPNSSRLLVERDDQSLLFYNFDTGQKMETPEDFKLDPTTAVAVTNAGEIILARGEQGKIALFNLATGTVRYKLCRCVQVMLSGDGQRVAAFEAKGDRFDRIRMWSTKDFDELPSLNTTSFMYRAAMNTDGSAVALGGYDGSVSISDASGVQNLSGSIRTPKSVEFLSNGRMWVVDTGGGIRSWDLSSSTSALMLRGSPASKTTLSPAARFVAVIGADGKVQILDAFTQNIERTGVVIPEKGSYSLSVSEHGDGITWETGSITFDFDTLAEARKSVDNWATNQEKSSPLPELAHGNFTVHSATREGGWKPKEVCKGESPIGVFYGGQLLMLNCSSSPQSGIPVPNWRVRFAASRGKVLVLAGDGKVMVRDRTDSAEIPTKVFIPIGADISPNQRFAAIFGRTAVTVIDIESKKVIQDWRPVELVHDSSVVSDSDGASPIAIADDGTIALNIGTGVIQLYTLEGHSLLSLVSVGDNQWLGLDRTGRFDTSDIEESGATVKWRAQNDPGHLQPIEIFMRDYFTPGLLTRVLKGEPLPPIRSIAEIANRFQPEVKILSVAPSENHPDRAKVMVHAQSHFDKERNQASGLQDLRLFRDGQLVGSGYVDLTSACAGNGSHPRRVHGGYIEGSLKDCEYTFHDVLLKSDTKKVTFTAYAFNSDRIKSATASMDYELTAPVATPTRPKRAYLLQIGVNHYAAGGCELSYSVNDAEKMSAALADRLKAQGYGVQAVKLESAKGGNVLAAGKQAIRGHLSEIAAQATPDDVFFMSFSGHGYSVSGGEFYVLPSDIQGSCHDVDAGLLQSAISADELASWLRSIDAGEMTLILDACFSAESVQAGEFKPGPLGSRGLGQLAYDKRMRILAASQSDEVAHEYDYLQHGLLTYVLTHDGLDEGEADWKPVDKKIMVGEWLAYAADAVPRFEQDKSKSSTSKAAGNRFGDSSATTSLQIPALFNFSKTDTLQLQ
jgi:WD40 repeat protein